MTEQRALSTLGGSVLSELAQWVQEQQQCKYKNVVLRLRQDDGTEMHVRDVALVEGSTPDAVAQGLLSRAQSAARIFQGHAAFVVTGYDAEGKACDLYTFNLGNDDRGGASRRDQVPSTEIVGMLMRHTHASAQLAIGHTNQIVDKYLQLLEVQSDELEKLRARVDSIESKSAKLMAMRWKREDVVLVQQADREETIKRWETFQMMIPFAATFLRPESAKPGDGVYMDDLIEKFISTIRPEQVGRLAAQLTPEQVAVFTKIYNAYNLRGAERAERRSASNGNAAPPSADATDAADDTDAADETDAASSATDGAGAQTQSDAAE
jgi:hypothetical protein